MSDDPTRRTGPDADPAAAPTPEPGELQLRKALAMTNDLEPPRDDLFAQRALMRGRARTARRRNAVLGTAAAVVLVGVVGTGWALSGGRTASSTSAGSAANAPERMNDKGSDAGAPGIAPGATGSLGSGSGSGPSLQGSQMPPARDTSEFFGALQTPATRAFDAVSATVTTRWPDVFSGAYADDAGGTSVVVAVTRRDPSLESFVTGAMPSGSVRFVDASHTWAEKVRVAQQVRDDSLVLEGQGIVVYGVGIDARGDRVVVSADERNAPGTLEQRYGDVVRVVATTSSTPGKLPNGGTLPTLQH
ncbi:hypothetical protein [Intrasporangium sp. YIM S08009]|uniref:hypothetical protein n=1 Tax=Intrasporangium zincisolvens TaxID=3080018 RepID=UPI002B0519ED|nr:hypothetical protein [Intrasporangium sp. YIM S08009]